MSHLNEEDVDQPVGRLAQEVELLEGKTEAEVPVGDVAEAKVPVGDVAEAEVPVGDVAEAEVPVGDVAVAKASFSTPRTGGVPSRNSVPR